MIPSGIEPATSRLVAQCLNLVLPHHSHSCHLPCFCKEISAGRVMEIRSLRSYWGKYHYKCIFAYVYSSMDFHFQELPSNSAPRPRTHLGHSKVPKQMNKVFLNNVFCRPTFRRILLPLSSNGMSHHKESNLKTTQAMHI